MNNTSKYVIREDKAKKCFEGSYKRAGAKLTHTQEPTIRLVIGTRQKPTQSKPKYFLLLMEGRDKSAIYFSSMYQTEDPNRFEMEHDRIRYSMLLDSDKAEVSVLNQSQQAA